MTETEHANKSGVQNPTVCVSVCAWDVFGVGIMSCRFAAPLHSTTTFPPLSYTTYRSPPLSLCHLCYCQPCESLFGRIKGTHICSRCNLVSLLSDKYLEEKLIIIVGGGDQRVTRRERGECFESKLWAYDFTPHPPPPPHRIAHSLQSHVRAGRDPFERD